MVSWKKLVIAYFYNTIKSLIRQFIGGFVGVLGTIPDDLLVALVGYIIYAKTQYKDEGEALMISAVASLGTATGGLIGLFGAGAGAGAGAGTTRAEEQALAIIR